MDINFPDSPTFNQEYSAGNSTWKWTGTSWRSVAGPGFAFNNTASITYQTTSGTTQFTYTDELLTKNNLWERGNATNTASPSLASSNVVIDCSDSNVHKITMTKNITLDPPTNPKSGQVINILFRQDSVGGWDVIFDPVFLFSSGSISTLTQAAYSRDLLSCQYDETSAVWLCVMSTGFA